jgi:hypothetical protein
MSTSQSSSSGSQPGQDPAATAIDPRFTNFLTALEQFGYGRGDDRRKPDPTRVRAAQDYDVLRGLLGRTDAPRALRMRRVPPGGGGGQKSQKGQKGQGGGDNAIEVVDPVPASASLAVVESPGAGAGPVREEFEVEGGSRPILALTDITAAMPISRVEIYDDDRKHDRKLVAFGPSAAPIA